MQKGFVVTPIIIICAGLIVAFLIHGYSMLNARMTSAIGIESALAKLHANEVKDSLDIENSLYWFSISTDNLTCTELQQYTQLAMSQQNRNGTVLVIPGESGYHWSYFNTNYSATIGVVETMKDMALIAHVPGNCT